MNSAFKYIAIISISFMVGLYVQARFLTKECPPVNQVVIKKMKAKRGSKIDTNIKIDKDEPDSN